MKLFERFQGLMASYRNEQENFTINLIGERQSDGHMFISSPELKGFSLMLDPEHTKNIGTLMNAIHDPLLIYVEALCHARDKARAESHLEIKKWGKVAANSYAVQLSPA